VNIRSVFLCGLALLVVSCLTAEPASGPTANRERVASPDPGVGVGVRREPADLPVLPGEAAVVAAFAQAGMPVRLIGGSKFEDLLGARRPARVFTASAEWGSGGADVLFLEDEIGDVRVCAAPGSIGRTIYTISVNGRSAGDIDAGQLVIFSIGPGYFAQAFDLRTSDALRQGLGLSAPRC
jgi:hypothetical protein